MNDPTVCSLVQTLFNVLTECVIGPCEGNQRILIENKKVIKVINTVFSMQCKQSQHSKSDIEVSRSALVRETAIVCI